MKLFSDKRLFFPLLLALAGVIIISCIEINQHVTRSKESAVIIRAENSLKQLSEKVKSSIGKIAGFSTEKEYHDFFIHSGLEKSGISFYIRKHGRITLWSDNEPVLEDTLKDILQNGKMIRLANGWFIPFFRHEKEDEIIGLVLVKHEYAYENKYLLNEFNPALNLPESFIVSAGEGIPLHGVNGSVLFHLKNDESENGDETGIPEILYLLSFLFFFPAAVLYGRKIFKSSARNSFLLVLGIAIARLLMIYFHIPDELYGTTLFGPKYYASSFFFNSPGDLLLNAMLLVLISFLCYSTVPRKGYNIPGASIMKAAVFFSLLVLVAGMHVLLSGLVINSKISLDVSDLSKLDVYSALAFLCMSLLLLSLFLLISAATRYFYGYSWSYKYVMLTIFACSVYTSLTVWQLNRKKELENRRLIVQKIDTRQDQVAEFLFDDVGKKISMDPDIAGFMKQAGKNPESLPGYISSMYFNGYLGKFEVAVYAFDTSGTPVDTLNSIHHLDYYVREAESQGRPTYCDKLFYLPGESGRLTYLSILPLNGPSGNSKGSLVLLLNAKFFQSEEGFPELFIGVKNTENTGLGQYSFARYSKGALVYEYGNYAYSFSLSEFGKPVSEYMIKDLGGFNHLVYQVNPASVIVVSKPQESTLYPLTLFSWIFVFFSLVLFLIYAAYRALTGRLRIHYNLNRRIQVSVLLLVVLSFILIGTGTVIYIFGKYNADQKRSISEQVNGLWFLLGSNVGTQEKLSGVPGDALFRDLNQLFSNLNIDFNLFDEKGKLFYSSQPKIFEQGIVSERMNPEAMFELKEYNRTQFIHPEKAGKLKYVSAYAPLTDNHGTITGYLNLPYFEKQNELNREVSGFLSALVNIYVLLFGLAVLATLFISSWITKPLLLIQEKLSGLRLGKRNEQIEYAGDDEIGQLVREYNRMVDELAGSAEKLAQSERESAWREMAKQVAHEIKNPLTPMRLSIQHLQQAWRENRDGKEEMIDRISTTLIQQIDTLSNIAAEFANFALMPKAKNERVNLNEVLESTVSLFGESSRVKVHFHPYPGDSSIVFDKDQVVRIFSNLLKNAVQSIPDTHVGKIELKIEDGKPGFLRVSVSDDGVGIPEDQRDKIFSPNFTTKSSGMGLGLAMVKNIVENVNGSIWFSSKYGAGTTFFIELPRTV